MMGQKATVFNGLREFYEAKLGTVMIAGCQRSSTGRVGENEITIPLGSCLAWMNAVYVSSKVSHCSVLEFLQWNQFYVIIRINIKKGKCRDD
jgi:hypothetical protein